MQFNIMFDLYDNQSTTFNTKTNNLQKASFLCDI